MAPHLKVAIFAALVAGVAGDSGHTDSPQWAPSKATKLAKEWNLRDEDGKQIFFYDPDSYNPLEIVNGLRGAKEVPHVDASEVQSLMDRGIDKEKSVALAGLRQIKHDLGEPLEHDHYLELIADAEHAAAERDEERQKQLLDEVVPDDFRRKR
jgi:hypothetical protein